jgi:hypothetical protein
MSYLFFLVYWFRLSPDKCNHSFAKQRFMRYLFSLCTGSTRHQASAIVLLRSSVLWVIFFPCVLVSLITRQVQSFFAKLGKCNRSFMKQRFMSYLFFSLVYQIRPSLGKGNLFFSKQSFISYLLKLPGHHYPTIIQVVVTTNLMEFLFYA